MGPCPGIAPAIIGIGALAKRQTAAFSRWLRWGFHGVFTLHRCSDAFPHLLFLRTYGLAESEVLSWTGEAKAGTQQQSRFDVTRQSRFYP